jgi:histone H3/H4
MENTMTENKEEILVVASKLKKMIKQSAGMNTSASVFPTLSEKVRVLCEQAVEHAKNEGRKTVMDRDFV